MSLDGLFKAAILMVSEFIFLLCMLEKPNDLHGCWINGAQTMLNELLMDKMKHTPPPPIHLVLSLYTCVFCFSLHDLYQGKP